MKSVHTGTLLVVLAVLLGLFHASPALAQDPEIECDGISWCKVTTTGLPLRLLAKPGARILLEMDDTSAAINEDVEPFSVLFAFEQVDVSYDANFVATGWFKVGYSADAPEGYVKAEQVVPWKQALALAFTNPGTSQRLPVLMFDSNDSLRVTLGDVQSGAATVDGIYQAVTDPATVPPGIISREGNAWVDIADTFYLLPILQFERLDAVASDLLGIQLAAMTNQAPSQASGACDLTAADADACLAAQAGGAISALALDVVFVIDTTGSMQPHIDAVTAAIREASQVLQERLTNGTDALKFGVVAYRDDTESTPDLEYVSKNFTPDLLSADDFQALLDSGVVVSASAGSGDWAEEVFAGMRDGIASNWSPQSARIIVLIGDASSHTVDEAKNTTGLSEVSIKDLASQQSVYVASIYVAGEGADTDLPIARPQFEGMAAGDATNGLAFSIVEAGQGTTNSEGGGIGLEQSLKDSLSKIIDFLASGNFNSIVSSNTAAGDTTGQALVSAVRAAFVDYIGSSATPPSDIVAWVVDRDMTDFETKNFDVKLMLQRGEVQELTSAIETILAKFREGQSSSASFLTQVQVGSTATAYDLKIDDTQALGDSPLVPLWIRNLPYKSDILTLSVQEFRDSSVDDRSRLEARLDQLIAYYDDILNRPDDWVQLNSQGTIEDAVYMLGLDNLP